MNQSKEREKIRARLAGAREAAGMSQSGLSLESGFSVNQISRWERPGGTTLPSIINLKRLCEALGCSADEILWP